MSQPYANCEKCGQQIPVELTLCDLCRYKVGEWSLKDAQKVAKEPCRCVRCGSCGGSGDIRVGLDGRRIECDDIYNLETCEDCGGSGITETCDRCQLLEDLDHDTF